jgi:aldehyde dehydrogenase (NAD+)
MTDYSGVLNKQRAFFTMGCTKDIQFRLQALKKLKKAILEQETCIAIALQEDLGKSPSEAYATEIGIVLHEIGNTIRHLRRWAGIKQVGTPLMHFPSASRRVPEPYGSVLIMSPWNYPFQLTLAPLIGAIAAGNCAVVKPSAYSPATSAVISAILRSCFGEEYVAVFEGGREANKALLNEKFDYIFFTGSKEVGKVVMESASRTLTPVTLELGGKSPCIVCADADVDLAARRIIWGKTLNAGQTCVAPDYVLAHRSIARKLTECMKKYIVQFFGADPCQNPEYPHMINAKHFNRALSYLKDGELFYGGRSNEEMLKIEPAILLGAHPDSPVMQEEIFAPVLPIVEFDELNEVISFVNNRPKPLALYLFTRNRQTESEVLGRISFGGGCVNDTIVHLATSALPFGGVGESGMGSYHGKWSFDTFTHWKSVLKKSNWIDVALRYPPYGKKLGIFKWILK